MARLKEREKIQNMANFIKKQSQELLYKLNQLSTLPDNALFQTVETLCEIAEQSRQQVNHWATHDTEES